MRLFLITRILLLPILLLGLTQPVFANSNINPSLWQIEKNGVTSYLVGTVHLGDQQMAGLPSYVKSAIEKTDKLVVEVDLSKVNPIEQQQVMMNYMMLPAGKTLQSELSAKNYKALSSYMAKLGLGMELFQQMQPFAVMLQITLMEYQKAGYQDSFGIDKQVMNVAQRLQIPIMQLETLEQQMGMFKGFSKHNNKMIEDGLKELADMDKYFNRLIGNWKRGNDSALENYYRETFTGDSYSALTEKVLLTDRNNNWVDQLKAPLTKQPHFIAVGALHLYGPQGLLKLLEKEGFKLSKKNK
ncbi:TraB family protein [Pseudoalteromonas sp. P1-9]|uniref:TraB/GumN family protein n=1 Tax=Pseudoalteromonas sp. P1-9 TaxID=1710354 RepID=UPI0006D61F79|nr:TraB/GumN family protein [Pseudoalteromonas sp. P1-9]KPV97913.1 TraB family protein [Pseudoalteromonas sp. P1-9]